MLFDLVLSLHIIAVICWFAGLFYLPRLFVYHAMSEQSVTKDQFTVMEYKLYYYIMHPSMWVTVITGVVLAHLAIWHGWWLHAKGALVLLLVIYHFYCGYFLKRFARHANTKSHRFFRVFNEIPTILLVVIILLVVVKP